MSVSFEDELFQIDELQNATADTGAGTASKGRDTGGKGGSKDTSESQLTGAAKMKADKQIKDLERKLGLFQKQDTAQKQEVSAVMDDLNFFAVFFFKLSLKTIAD